MKMGFVYFIGAKDGDTIKIGFSVNPESRIRQVQSGNPERLSVLFQFRGHKDTEQCLHRLFGPSRLSGEWFGNAEAIRSFARMLERSHAKRAMELMGVEDWPTDIESQGAIVDRCDEIPITQTQIRAAAKSAFSVPAASA